MNRHFTLHPIDAAKLTALQLPPRKAILKPWLEEKGSALLYAWRGLGKTHFALGTAYAIAGGKEFLGWEAPEPRSVMYIDGEMHAEALKERLMALDRAQPLEDPSRLKFLAADLHPTGLPNLATEDGQEALEEHLEGVDVIILDNLSTLIHTGDENEANSWDPVQRWLLDQRRKGRAVIFIHHAGKGGNQRGTSKKEDAVEVVIKLQRPSDYRAEEGARFEVHFEKCRSVAGDALKSFEAVMTVADGAVMWSRHETVDELAEQVVALKDEGLSFQQIADRLGITKARAHRIHKKACEVANAAA